MRRAAWGAAFFVSGGLLRQERHLALDPMGEARSREDPIDVSDSAWIPLRIDLGVRVQEIGEGTRDGEIGKGQPVADQISALVWYDLLEIIEDRGQIVEHG